MAYGIDIGSSLSMLVNLTGQGSAMKLQKAVVLPGVKIDTDQKPESYASHGLASTWRGLRSLGVKAGKPVTLIPGRDIVYRTIAVSGPDSRVIESMVRLEADEISGGSGGILGSHIMGQAPDGSPTAVIGLARDAVVDHYASTLLAMGVDASLLVPGCVALYSAYQLSGDMTFEGTYLIANIGDEVTDVIIVKEGSLLFARTVAIGVNDFLDRLGPEYGGDRDAIRQVLFRDIDLRPGVAAENISSDRGVEAGQEVASRLFQQIGGVIMLAKGAHSDPKLDATRISLCGPGAAIPGLRELMMQRTRKTVEIFDPLGGLTLEGADEATQEAAQSYRPALTLAIGLARIATDKQASRMHFVPGSVRKRREFLNKSLFLYLAAAIVLAVVLPTYALARKTLADMTAGETELRAEMSRYSGPSGQLPARVEAYEEAKRRAAVSLNAIGPGNTATKVLTDFAAKRPDTVQIRSVTLKEPDKKAEEGKPQIPPMLVFEFFIERKGTSDPKAVRDQLRDILKALPGVAAVAPVGTDVETTKVQGLEVKFNVELKIEEDVKP